LTSATLDGNGNGISEGSPIDDFKWSFTTEQYINPDKSPPNIVSINPLNNAQNVLINTSIQVIFNESMNKSTTETAFSIIPKVDGNFNWAGNDKICTFVPLSNFNYSTTYDIIISGVAKDLAGNTLDGNKNGIGEGSIFDDFEWSFKTEKFIPISVLVYPINQEILGQTPYFKWTLDNKITNATPAVYYDYYLSSNESLVENLDDSACVVHNLTNNIYQVLINISNEYYWTVIPHTNDTFGYCKSGVWHFRVDVPPWDSIPPQIVSIYPKNNSIDINVDSNIQVIFNEPMNWTSVEQAFSIYPEVDGDFRWTDNNTIMTFYPQNYFETSKMYFVNISTLAKDSAGNPLDGNKNFNRDGSPLDDYIWSFTTAAVQNLKPKIKIDFPKNGSVFNINETIYFDCINSTDPDGDILEFLWKSNISGILSTAPQFNIYLPIGHHQITLFVNDGHGHNISASVNIIVTPWNRPPTAVISSPLDGAVFNATELIYFDALNSSDPDNDILSFYWHSNISGGLGQSPKFKMKLPAGHHLITLFVSDPFYHTVNVSINIYVLNGSSGPPANGNGPAPLKPPDTGTDSNIIARVGLYSGIIAIIIIIIITAFITTTEVGKYGFLGYVMPLYSRIKGKKVLDNETRGMIR
ncbi:MAG: Ig-like domain-containing protein, partial [Thermoplasmata archaeon]|nr:Ig-like domain-containing protein [Thermoplasmata archaeon]